ncbi:unnamed protein product [Durusdinium trenchii]|uniref:Uncharacterized protein n=2 Tax=Durusdinium trenchii TaxID=1381693 RepID=A0ABP0L937_9DINO
MGHVSTVLVVTAAVVPLTPPLPALAVAPSICVLRSGQDLLLGYVRRDLWRCRAGALGLATAGCGLALGQLEQAASAEQLAPSFPTAFLQRARRALIFSKRAVAARRGFSRWTPRAIGRFAYSASEVVLSLCPQLLGRRQEVPHEIELQALPIADASPAPHVVNIGRVLDEEILEVEDGWLLLPENVEELLRYEVEELLMEHDVFSIELQSLPDAARLSPMLAAIGQGANCSAVSG